MHHCLQFALCQNLSNGEKKVGLLEKGKKEEEREKEILYENEL